MYKTAHRSDSLVLGVYQLDCAILDILRDRVVAVSCGRSAGVHRGGVAQVARATVS